MTTSKKINFIESREKKVDALKEITDQLERGVQDIFKSNLYKQVLDTMAKFPRYSANNSILILMQKPEASLCQSYSGWKKMGRFVKKGEKGINILAPAPYKIECDVQKQNSNGKLITEKQEVEIMAFKVVKTFDLSQTDGKELPTIEVTELVGSIDGYQKLIEVLKEISQVTVSFKSVDSNVKGYYSLIDKEIVIKEGMSEVQTIKTLIHEMAHQKLHDKDFVIDAEKISRNEKEVQAESIAYVVCKHYDINTSDYSFSYVASWSSGKETRELKDSLGKIRQTASEFITKIDEKLNELESKKHLAC